MNKILKDYMVDFDVKFKDLDFIDKSFHEKELEVVSFASKAKTRDARGNFSEEYIRTRFVYALVNSGYFPKEILCIEFNIPKGNNGKSIKPDIIAFKNTDWIKVYEDAKKIKILKK